MEGKKQNKLRVQDIDRVLETYKKRKSVDKYAYLASLSEISKNDYNLNISLYVDTSVDDVEINIFAVQEEIDEIEKELLEVRKKMKKYLKEFEI